MTNTRNNKKKACLKLCAGLMFPFALFCGTVLTGSSHSTAEAVANATWSDGHSQDVSMTNATFKNGSKPYATGNDLSGWNAIETESKASGMIIDVGNNIENDEGKVENKTFSEYKDEYMLVENPERKDGNSSDTRILMINSKASKDQKNIQAQKGYRSSELTLEANSYYIFNISVKTMTNGDESAEASIYINGLKDKDGKAIKIAREKIDSRDWKDFQIMIATGKESQKVTMDLYLGSKTTKSMGAVFFDNASVYRYSENYFYNNCTIYGYKGTDNYTEYSNDKIFIIEALKEAPKLVAGTENYNFDFEDDIDLNNTLGNDWMPITHSNGKAQIMNYADLSTYTNYTKLGNDLSRNNNQALMLWTDRYSTGYVGVKSQDIKIAPHAIYKVSLKLKLSDMEQGSFYVKLTENDYIYSVYKDILSKDNYTLQSEQSSGYNSNSTNEWTNDYQTVEFYLKGHSLYYSSVNLELWLGNSSSYATGLAVIDNIQIEYATDSEFSSASNKKELTSYSGTYSQNNSFDSVTVTEKGEVYPLTAQSWNATTYNDKHCESGVIHLGTKEQYDDAYDKTTYPWAGINPYNSNGSNKPANVYMMFNKTNTYQSLTSPEFTLSGNEYHCISFDYYNQSHPSGTLNPSQIKIEVIDKNGIVIFSQDNISSIDQWNKMKIYFRTTSSSTHNVTVKIYFGEKNKTTSGLVYLDNFEISASTENAFASGTYTSSLLGFYMDIDLPGEKTNSVISTSAYKFTIDEIYDTNYSNSTDCSFGGIAYGDKNFYGVTNNKDNFLALTNRVASKSSLTSNFTQSLSANSYYKFTFSLATFFGAKAENASTDKHECNYGVSITFDGYESVENLVTGGVLRDDFVIYIKTGSEATTPTIKFSLVSDCDHTVGSAVMTNLDIKPATVDDYITCQEQPNSYGKTVFTSTVAEVEEDKTEEDIPTENPDENEGQGTDIWLAIPAIITGLAIVIGVIAYFFKKIKIKKIEKIQDAVYDKRLTINHDLIVKEAQKRRDEEVQNLQNLRANLENEKIELDNRHKEFIRTQREKDNGKLSKDIERAFKSYNKQMSILNEKINIIKEKIDTAMSAEHLISIERKIVAEEDRKNK